MERTNLQQNELDNVEKRILITLFGNDRIPNSSAIVLKMMGINPNNYIAKFENMMIPIMKKDGKIDGKIIKKLIQVSKYRDVMEFINIPDEDFLLSDVICNVITSFLPGVSL